MKVKPGQTYTWAFYNTIGDAEDATEATALTMDTMTDDKFSVLSKNLQKQLDSLIRLTWLQVIMVEKNQF